jgi:hypothetical protein
LTHPTRSVLFISGEDSDTTKSSSIRHWARPTLAKLHGSCNYYLVERPDPGKQRVSEGETMKLTPEQMPELLRNIAKDRVRKVGSVQEIGAGQSDKTLTQFGTLEGAHGSSDLVVMPVRPGQKSDKLVETIAAYVAAGFDPTKLALTYNLLEPGKTAADMWATPAFSAPIPSVGMSLVDHSKKWGYRMLQNGVPSSDAIRKLRELPQYTIGMLAGGQVDFAAEAAKLWEAGKDKDGDQVFELHVMAMGAKSVVKHIDRMVQELFGLPADFTLAEVALADA